MTPHPASEAVAIDKQAFEQEPKREFFEVLPHKREERNFPAQGAVGQDPRPAQPHHKKIRRTDRQGTSHTVSPAQPLGGHLPHHLEQTHPAKTQQ
jgi:hypothetical protein